MRVVHACGAWPTAPAAQAMEFMRQYPAQEFVTAVPRLGVENHWIFDRV